MYISKKTAFIVSAICMAGSMLIVIKLQGSGDDMAKETSAFLNALAIFLFAAAAIIAGVFDLFPDE